jgi:hypothetical protein
MADVGEPPPLCPLCGHPTHQAVSAASPPPLLFSAQQARPPLKRRHPPEAPLAVVRVEVGDEAAALREALARQQAALGDLQAELDAERGAAAGAASEAMTMILRLQREKAEAMMEARQFRRYAEEKMSHDAAELAALEDALAKRDAALVEQTPRCGGAAASGASTPRRPPASPSPASSASGCCYPALRCLIDHPPTASEADALDCAHQTPLSRLAPRVHLLERGATTTPAAVTTTTPVIRVAPGSAFPRRHAYYSDDDDDGSLDFRDGGDFLPDDDGSDRVYTVDAVHGGAAPLADSFYGGSTPVSLPWAAEDDEVRWLSSRLQALEADRESMRQAIIDMGANKAQDVLLKEIAQKLCSKEHAAPPPVVPVAAQHSYYKTGNTQPAVTVTVRPPRRPPIIMQRTVVKRQPLQGTSFLAAVVKVNLLFLSSERMLKYTIFYS